MVKDLEKLVGGTGAGGGLSDVPIKKTKVSADTLSVSGVEENLSKT